MQKIKIEGLKDCPFCGGEAELCTSEMLGNKMVYVRCTVCGCSSSHQMAETVSPFSIDPTRVHTLEECIGKVVGQWDLRVCAVG